MNGNSMKMIYASSFYMLFVISLCNGVNHGATVSEANTGTYSEMHSLKTLQSVINLLQLEISFSAELEIGLQPIRKLAVFSNMKISLSYWNAANLHIGCILQI